MFMASVQKESSRSKFFNRNQSSEVRGQMTEVRGQKTDVRGQRTDVKYLAGYREQKTE